MLRVKSQQEAAGFLAECFSFFDFEEYQVKGVSRIIRPVQGLRFLDTGATYQYLEVEESLLSWFLSLCQSTEEAVWLSPSAGMWLAESSKRVSADPTGKAVRRWLRQHGLKRDFRGLVGCSDADAIRNLASISLRGFGQITFLFPRAQAVIVPCDHGDLHVFLSDASPMLSKIEELPSGLERLESCLD
jgi:hypothetical protein